MTEFYSPSGGRSKRLLAAGAVSVLCLTACGRTAGYDPNTEATVIDKIHQEERAGDGVSDPGNSERWAVDVRQCKMPDDCVEQRLFVSEEEFNAISLKSVITPNALPKSPLEPTQESTPAQPFHFDPVDEAAVVYKTHQEEYSGDGVYVSRVPELWLLGLRQCGPDKCETQRWFVSEEEYNDLTVGVEVIPNELEPGK